MRVRRPANAHPPILLIDVIHRTILKSPHRELTLFHHLILTRFLKRETNLQRLQHATEGDYTSTFFQNAASVGHNIACV